MKAEEKHRSHPVQTWGIGILISLVLYVLSVGPMVCLHRRFGLHHKPALRKTFEIIYYPDELARKKSETYKEFSDSYVRWWLDATY